MQTKLLLLLLSAALFQERLCAASQGRTANWLGDYQTRGYRSPNSGRDVIYKLQLKRNGVCRMTDQHGKWRRGWYRTAGRRICVSSDWTPRYVGWFSGASIIFLPTDFWGHVNSSGALVKFVRRTHSKQRG
jgi:hypothetical protein